jgi:GDPmannose 4,6-dehydratase
VAKVYGHWITVNYRESYDLHASSGILFNHESVPAETPVVIRQWGYIDICPIGALAPHPSEGESGAQVSYPGGDLEIWDGDRFVRCLARTAYWHEGESVVLHGRGGIVESTPDHVVFTPGDEQAADSFLAGDRLRPSEQPPPTRLTTLTREEAWLLGMIVAEGSIQPNGKARITCGDEAALAEAAACWDRVSGGWSRKHAGVRSGFSENRTSALELNGNRDFARLLRGELYLKDGHKRVPKRILNAAPHLQEEFLAAYNIGDGLRAGHGIDRFKSFRTNSPTLAAGLVWLARTTLGRRVSLYLQPGALGGGESYLIDLGPGRVRGNQDAHLRRPQDVVRKVERRSHRGWMCDLATESERFAAGPGFVVVHNSPRRGLEFVTRKISHTAARIKLGQAEELRLGNLDAQRDWGLAGDYVEAMWLMLQQDEPDNYVVSTDETHSVREFCEIGFGHLGLDWEEFVVVDDAFMRPAEVDLLVGDSARARKVLGWSPTVGFQDLVTMMVDADLDLLNGKLRPIS